MNPYYSFVVNTLRMVDEARSLPMGDFAPAARPSLALNAPVAMFFSPHPDDECISGGIALRLLREAKMNVVNVAVTQGSNKERQAARFQELQGACNYLGFGLQTTGPRGLERINAGTRQKDAIYWANCVATIKSIIDKASPRVLMFPHERDWNSTHIGTHFLVLDALGQMPRDFECVVVETEFWGAMDDPNLMVELSPADVADMVTALTFHAGEVNRNPYHLLLPAWMMDNVRRGSEVAGGQGGSAPDFRFAVLNRVRKWRNGKLERFFEGSRKIPASVSIETAFA